MSDAENPRVAVLAGDALASELASLLVREDGIDRLPDAGALLASGADEVVVTGSPAEAIELLRRVEGKVPSLTVLIASPGEAHPHVGLLKTLSRVKREWEATFDSIVDPLALLDARGHIRRANLAFARAVGQKIQEIQGISYKTLLGSATTDPIARTIEDNQARTEEVRYAGLPGIQQVTVCPLGADGGGPGFVLLLKDLTQQADHQDRLRRAARLADIGQLAAGVAHEINTPLASIALRAESLLRAAEDPRLKGIDSFRNFPRHLKTIEEETFRCKKIIEGLLDFSVPRKAENRPLDLNGLAQSAADLVGYQMKMKQVELSVRLEPGLPLVFADDGQLRQVLIALMMNALDATRVGGHVGVETKSDTGGKVVLSVSDDGPGIPPEIIGKIFTPFFTTKPAGQGTGLGLAICHTIVTSHGGEIKVESPGVGTRFSLFLSASR